MEVIRATAAALGILDESGYFSREHVALLRIAALAADGTGQDEVFKAVAVEATALTGAECASLIRFDGDHEYTVVGHNSGSTPVGTRIAVDLKDEGLIAMILRSERTERVDGQRDRGAAGYLADAYVAAGVVGVPLTVDGRLWGVVEVSTGSPLLSRTAELRLQHFAGLVTGAVANANARAQLQALADERASIRRIHAVAGRGGTGAEVLAAVAAEGSAWLDGLSTALVRLEVDGTSAVVATCGQALETEPLQMHGGDPVGTVVRSAASSAGASVGVPISIADRVWGVFVAMSPAGAMPLRAEDRLARFVEAITPTILSAQARTQLAEEQFALCRVAELAARDAPEQQVLGAVVLEASAAANVEFTTLLRYHPDGSTEIVALHGAPDGFVVGMREPGAGDGAVQRVSRTGQLARTENMALVPGRWSQIATRSGFRTSVAVPISIQGALWGALVGVGRPNMVPSSTEERLSRFAELAGVAMSAAQARRDLRLLAEEQVALSRVAALVVRGAALDEVFTAVAAEASGLLGDIAVVLVRLETDSSFVLVAAANSSAPVGFRGQLDQGAPLGDLIRTGVPESFNGAAWAEAARQMGIGPTVVVPVAAERRLWGLLTVSNGGRAQPDSIEHRLRKFAELAGAAIASAENKAKLTASRARVVATADETRRRLQRHVHDNAQQRLVHTILALKLARQSIAAGNSADALVDEALLNAERASTELRDIVREILPAALTRGGLHQGLESLLADLALPVDLHMTAPRVSIDTEQTAYFIVAEALTNAAQHAHADRATVSVTFDGETLTVEVRDDGIGGADPAVGTGLIGLADRVDAVGGDLTLTSPPGGGTTVLLRLPVQAPYGGR